MHDLKEIVYNSFVNLAAKREQKYPDGGPDPPFRFAFYYNDIANEVNRNASKVLYSKRQIKKQLMALEKEGAIKMILTCTPMWLTCENHKKYFEDKACVKITVHDKNDVQKVRQRFPNSQLLENGKFILTQLTFYEFHMFKSKHKDLSQTVELEWEKPNQAV